MDEELIDAVMSNQVSRLYSLLDKGVKLKWNSCVIQAAQFGYDEVIHALLEHGLDVNKKDNIGNTILIGSCIGHQENIVRFLLDKGADPNIVNDRNHRAIDFVYDDPAILRLLLKKGAEPKLHEMTLQNVSNRECIRLLAIYGMKD